MAALTHLPPPPRTPSPKIRIHRSQSFDSPSSRISVTPIDDSPYSKSASAICAKPFPLPLPLPSCNLLHTKMSDDSIMSDASSIESSPVSEISSEGDVEGERGRERERGRFDLFQTGSPVYPTSLPSTSPQFASSPSSSPSSSSSSSSSPSANPPSHPRILSSSIRLLQFQEASTPMFDPWLVRMVLDMFDVRGFDWMSIADPIERVWGVRTGSAEVLEILVGNGRVRRVWWE